MLTFILSAELSNLTVMQNKKRTDTMRRILEGLELDGVQVTEARGMYKGTEEVSFKVSAASIDLEFILMVARNFGQESILYVDPRANAYLIYLESHEVAHIGTWTKVDTVEGLEAYTAIGTDLYAVA